eukprot:150278_1
MAENKSMTKEIQQIFETIDKNNKLYYQYLVAGFIHKHLNLSQIYNVLPFDVLNLLILCLGTQSKDIINHIKSFPISITNNQFPAKLCRSSKMNIWAEVLNNNIYSNIQTIIIKHCALQSLGIMQLCNALKYSCKNLKYLDFTGNEICLRSCKAIGHLLMPLTIDLDSFSCTDQKRVQSTLITSEYSYIETLILSQNPIGGSGAELIGKALCFTKHLKYLQLENCEINDLGLKYLRRGIERNTSICDINVAANKFNDRGAREIQAWILRNSSLQKLDISRNDLGPDGTLTIAKGFACTNTKSVKYLKSNMNHIGDQGAKAFAKMLTLNQTLEILELCFNQIYDDGARVLIQGLARNYGLKKIILWFNKLGNGWLTFLQKGLKQRSEQVFFKDNMINSIVECTELMHGICQMIVEYLPIYMDFEIDVSCHDRISKRCVEKVLEYMCLHAICGVKIVCKRKSEIDSYSIY